MPLDETSEGNAQPDPVVQLPGAVINPGTAPVQSQASVEAPLPQPESPPSSSDTTPIPDIKPQPETPEPTSLVESTGGKLNEEEQASDTPSLSGVSWTADEYIAHDKSISWYLGLASVAVVFSVLIFLITKDLVSSIVIIVAAIILGVYGSRRPRQLQYSLNASGLSIGSKQYSLDEFKSFSVISEGDHSNISFMPLKRFSPIISIYYSPEDEKNIMALLSAQLPYEEPRRDAVDSLMRRIRF